MAGRIANLPSPAQPWVDPKTGKPTDSFRLFMTLYAAGNHGPFPEAADDAAAARAGVAVDAIYHTGGTMKVRLT
jgi:hypothetical protein